MVNLKLHGDVCDLCSVVSGNMQYLSEKVINNETWYLFLLSLWRECHVQDCVIYLSTPQYCVYFGHLCFSVFFAVPWSHPEFCSWCKHVVMCTHILYFLVVNKPHQKTKTSNPASPDRLWLSDQSTFIPTEALNLWKRSKIYTLVVTEG